MCDVEAFRFWSKFFDWSLVFFTLCAIAWTRHGQTESEQWHELLHPKPVLIRNFETVSLDDPLNAHEKERLRTMIELGNPLTRDYARLYGFTRAHWNRTRVTLVNLGYAEFRADGDLILRDGIFRYLGAQRPGGL